MNVDEEPKRFSSNLVTLSENLELDMQEDNFIELFVVQYIKFTNEDLMKLEAQKRETGGRCNNKNKRFYDAGNGSGIFFI